ncbi:restriction endonuclease [Streptomyces sp. NPDC055749]
MTHTVLHDPESILAESMPLDREMHLALSAAVLAWEPAEAGLRSADVEQISLQLTGHARCVASDLRNALEHLPKDSELRPLTEVVLREAVRRLSAPSHNSVPYAQNRARLVRALYRALDRLGAVRPTVAT